MATYYDNANEMLETDTWLQDAFHLSTLLQDTREKMNQIDTATLKI